VKVEESSDVQEKIGRDIREHEAQEVVDSVVVACGQVTCRVQVRDEVGVDCAPKNVVFENKLFQYSVPRAVRKSNGDGLLLVVFHATRTRLVMWGKGVCSAVVHWVQLANNSTQRLLHSSKAFVRKNDSFKRSESFRLLMRGVRRW
jgi:hypothetical protein